MDTAVDLRGLEPPEPLLRILDALDTPGPGPLVFLLSREPLPLYAMLAGGEWSHTVRRGDSGVELTLMRR